MGPPQRQKQLRATGHPRGAAAYKNFLFDYIDAKFSVDNFACDPSEFSASKPVADIIVAIKSKKIT